MCLTTLMMLLHVLCAILHPATVGWAVLSVPSATFVVQCVLLSEFALFNWKRWVWLFFSVSMIKLCASLSSFFPFNHLRRREESNNGSVNSRSSSRCVMLFALVHVCLSWMFLIPIRSSPSSSFLLLPLAFILLSRSFFPLPCVSAISFVF